MNIESKNTKSKTLLDSKKRAYLKGYASKLDAAFQIGKGGITEELAKSIADYLRAHEIVKFKCLESSLYTAREAAEQLAEMTDSEVVVTIGSKAVLYKRNPKKPIIDFKS